MELYEKKMRARLMYMQGAQIKEIAEKLNLSEAKVRNWAYNGTKEEQAWREMRDQANAAVEEAYDAPPADLEDPQTLDDVYNLATSIVRRSLAVMDAQQVVLDAGGIDKLVSMLEKIDRWDRTVKQNDSNDSKSAEDESIDLKQAMEDIKNHPFLSDEP